MARTMLLAAAVGLASLPSFFLPEKSLREVPIALRGSGIAEPTGLQDPLEQPTDIGTRTLMTPTSPLAVPALKSSLHPLPRPAELNRQLGLAADRAKEPVMTQRPDPDFRPRLRPGDLLLPDPPGSLADASDLLCIAVAVYHEARSQPLDGQLAVASVILNRAKAPERWGATPCAVVAPIQFSFLGKDGRYPPIRDREAWAIAVEMAREVLERGPSPLVGPADHYHTPAVNPDWNEQMRQVIRIDDHIFFFDPTTSG